MSVAVVEVEPAGQESARTRLLCDLLLVVGVLLSAPWFLFSSDTGYHLASGRVIVGALLGQGPAGFPYGDLLAFTSAGVAEVNAEWGTQVVFALAERIGGDVALVLLKLGLLALAWLLAVRLARRLGAPTIPTLAIALALVPMAAERYTERPHVVALLLTLSTLWLLSFVLEGKTRRALWLPALQLAWVNLHGSFVLEWVLVGGGAAVAALASLAGSAESAKERRQQALWLAGALALTLVAALANPYGLRVLDTVVKSADPLYAQVVVEWKPPGLDDRLTLAAVILTGVVGLAALARLLTEWRAFVGDPRRVLLAGAFLLAAAMTVRSRRFLDLMTICALPLAALGLPRFAQTARARRTGALVALLALALIPAWVSPRGIYDPSTSLSRRLELPQAASRYLVAQKVRGRVLNAYNSGLFLLWHNYPDVVPFATARVVHGPGFIARYDRAVSDPVALAAEIARYDIDLVLLDIGEPATQRTTRWLESDARFRLVVLELRYALFVRCDRHAELCRTEAPFRRLRASLSLDYLPEQLAKDPSGVAAELATLRDLSRQLKTPGPALLADAIEAFAALSRALEAPPESPTARTAAERAAEGLARVNARTETATLFLYEALARLALGERERERARGLLRRVLKIDPGATAARELLKRIDAGQGERR